MHPPPHQRKGWVWQASWSRKTSVPLSSVGWKRRLARPTSVYRIEDTDSRVITAGLEVLASGGLQQSRQLGIREEGLGLSGNLRLLNPESLGSLEAGVP